MTIIDTTPETAVLRNLYRKELCKKLSRKLFDYFCEVTPDEYNSDDMYNLTEQAMSALDAILAGYQQVKERAKT